MSESPHATQPSRWKSIIAGAWAGLLAAIVMTALMLLLMSAFGIAMPFTLIGDRLSAFIPVDQFLALMGRVGGYNHMKQLGVASVIGGQLLLGALGGAIYGAVLCGAPERRRSLFSLALFVLLPLAVTAVVLWPVLGTHYGGLPERNATIATLLGLLLSFVAFERTLVLSFRGMFGRPRALPADAEYTPPIGRRALIMGGLGLLVAGGGYALLRKLCAAATFSYDGLQYKGADVQPITPNDRFYTVTKNVVDPEVRPSFWRLEVNGLVKTRQRYKLDRFKALGAVVQETTLMCISNGLGAGLMSNAAWKGVPLHTLLEAAGPLSTATKVRLHGVDNYTDTIPLAKALEPTTLVAYEMNGEPLPQRHGFPARLIVPGYFGEKSVKWLTRIELADDKAIGFYEKQGRGPNFIVPTRSRIDQPENEAQLSAGGTTIKGVAFGGDRGISRVEVSTDGGATWADAKIDYPGTKLTWVLWSYQWQPPGAGDHVLTVRATDGDGKVQELDESRPFKSGATGFDKIAVHVTA
ncbi:MAG: molybdopterin-dependent oxidoreductase [Verrucomicrobiota bacterium]|nr:molybdopterin-dependent oxidoreductase [Verrucomicrobiota bacterium]